MDCSYAKLAVDVQPGSQILIADGSIVLEVLSTNPKAGTVRAKCLNNATLGCASEGPAGVPASLFYSLVCCAQLSKRRPCKMGMETACGN